MAHTDLVLWKRRRVSKATGAAFGRPDNRLRVPTPRKPDRSWARRSPSLSKGGPAHLQVSNSHFDLWGSGERFVEGEGGHELLPGGEDDVDGDGSQVVEESGAGVDFGSGFLPCQIGEVGDGVAGECQEIESDEHGGQVVGSVAEIVFEIVPLGFERVERF